MNSNRHTASCFANRARSYVSETDQAVPFQIKMNKIILLILSLPGMDIKTNSTGFQVDILTSINQVHIKQVEKFEIELMWHMSTCLNLFHRCGGDSLYGIVH